MVSADLWYMKVDLLVALFKYTTGYKARKSEAVSIFRNLILQGIRM